MLGHTQSSLRWLLMRCAAQPQTRHYASPTLAATRPANRSPHDKPFSQPHLVAKARTSCPTPSYHDAEMGTEKEVVLRLALDGASMYIGGEAGTGKSFLLRRIAEELRQRHGLRVAVTASTGIAAVNIDGGTMHSTLGVPVCESAAETMMRAAHGLHPRRRYTRSHSHDRHDAMTPRSASVGATSYTTDRAPAHARAKTRKQHKGHEQTHMQAMPCSFDVSASLRRRHSPRHARPALPRGTPALYDAQVLSELDVLIVDEVSMLHAGYLEALDHCARAAEGRQRNKPFGGLQIILAGDFLQLTPWNLYRRSTTAPSCDAMRRRCRPTRVHHHDHRSETTKECDEIDVNGVDEEEEEEGADACYAASVKSTQRTASGVVPVSRDVHVYSRYASCAPSPTPCPNTEVLPPSSQCRPCVRRSYDYYAQQPMYASYVFQHALLCLNLREPMRQCDDPDFLADLQALRRGELRPRLARCAALNPPAEHAIRLFATRREVRVCNEAAMRRLRTPAQSFTSRLYLPRPVSRATVAASPMPPQLACPVTKEAMQAFAQRQQRHAAKAGRHCSNVALLHWGRRVQRRPSAAPVRATSHAPRPSCRPRRRAASSLARHADSDVAHTRVGYRCGRRERNAWANTRPALHVMRVLRQACGATQLSLRDMHVCPLTRTRTSAWLPRTSIGGDDTTRLCSSASAAAVAVCFTAAGTPAAAQHALTRFLAALRTIAGTVSCVPEDRVRGNGPRSGHAAVCSGVTDKGSAATLCEKANTTRRRRQHEGDDPAVAWTYPYTDHIAAAMGLSLRRAMQHDPLLSSKTLKVGCRVMLICNLGGALVNGLLGTIVKFARLGSCAARLPPHLKPALRAQLFVTWAASTSHRPASQASGSATPLGGVEEHAIDSRSPDDAAGEVHTVKQDRLHRHVEQMLVALVQFDGHVCPDAVAIPWVHLPLPLSLQRACGGSAGCCGSRNAYRRMRHGRVRPSDALFGEVVGGRVVCMPLIPAYAFTVHKVQGVTFDTHPVLFDGRGMFACDHMLYVAASRVRRLSQLRMIHVSPSMATVHQPSLRFSDSLPGVCEALQRWWLRTPDQRRRSSCVPYAHRRRRLLSSCRLYEPTWKVRRASSVVTPA